MSKVKKIRMKQTNGQLSGYIPIGADAKNIDMKNGYTVEDVIGSVDIGKKGSIANQIETIDNNIEEIKNNFINLPNFFLGVFFQQEEPFKLDWYVSLDGVGMSKIDVPGVWEMRDVSIQFNKKNNKFYVCQPGSNTFFTLHESSDLKNWKTYTINFTVPGPVVWAPDLYIDEDGIGYVVLSSRYSEGEEVITGEINFAFDEYITICRDFNSLNFEPAYKIDLIESPNRNHIDGSLIKINNVYYLTVKNEYSKINEIFSSTDLKSWHIINRNVTGTTLWVEGPQVVRAGEYLYYYADLYMNQSYIVGKTTLDSFPTKWESGFNEVKGLHGTHRHGSVIYIDSEEAKKAICKISNFSFININENEKNIHRTIVLPGADKAYKLERDYLPILPNTTYTVQGGSGERILKLGNIFGESHFNMTFESADDVVVKITSILTQQGNETPLRVPLEIRNLRSTNERVISIPLQTVWNDVSYAPLSCYEYASLSSTDENSNIHINGDFSGKIELKRRGLVVSAVFSFTSLTDNYTEGMWANPLADIPKEWSPFSNIMINNDQGFNMQIQSDKIVSYIKLNRNQTVWGTAMWIL